MMMGVGESCPKRHVLRTKKMESEMMRMKTRICTKKIEKKINVHPRTAVREKIVILLCTAVVK